MLVLLASTIIGVSWAFSREVLPFAEGSIVAFSAWWFLFYLTSGQMSVTSLGAMISFFILATGLLMLMVKGARQVSHTAR
jgi:hypothetical protein